MEKMEKQETLEIEEATNTKNSMQENNTAVTENDSEINKEQKNENTEASFQKELKDTSEKAEINKTRISKLEESIKKTQLEFDRIRQKFGLPPLKKKEKMPSNVSSEKAIKDLEAEQEILQTKEEELMKQLERERLIREEKQKILNEIFEEFDELKPEEFENLLNTGKKKENQKFESSSIGEIDPGTVKVLAKAHKEELKKFRDVFEEFPEEMEEQKFELNKNITKEAIERVGEAPKNEKTMEGDQGQEILETKEINELEPAEDETKKTDEIKKESSEPENIEENTQTAKEKISPDKLLEESTDIKKEEIKNNKE
jgi:hypothetical protein